MGGGGQGIGMSDAMSRVEPSGHHFAVPRRYSIGLGNKHDTTRQKLFLDVSRCFSTDAIPRFDERVGLTGAGGSANTAAQRVSRNVGVEPLGSFNAESISRTYPRVPGRMAIYPSRSDNKNCLSALGRHVRIRRGFQERDGRPPHRNHRRSSGRRRYRVGRPSQPSSRR